MVLFDQGTYDKLLVEVPKYKLITPSVLSDRLRVSTPSIFYLPCGLCDGYASPSQVCCFCTSDLVRVIVSFR